MAVTHPLAQTDAFSLTGVGFSFGLVSLALADISVAAHTGRLTVILGQNGAGKSVLLSLLAGLRKPTQGQVLFKGQDMAQVPAKALAAQVAWVPHQTSGGDFFSVREAVEMGRVSFDEPRARVRTAAARALALFELTELAEAQLGTLSGGQRRRVLFARAMAQLDGADGGVLLLDEPDANLDPAQAVFLFQKLRLLVAQGLTVVAVVHDLHLASEFGDEAWLMRGGRLIAAGAAGEVLTAERLSGVYGVRVGEGMGWKVG